MQHPNNLKYRANVIICCYNVNVLIYLNTVGTQNLVCSLGIMCSESVSYEFRSLLVQVTLVPLREAVARKVKDETRQLW